MLLNMLLNIFDHSYKLYHAIFTEAIFATLATALEVCFLSLDLRLWNFRRLLDNPDKLQPLLLSVHFFDAALA